MAAPQNRGNSRAWAQKAPERAASASNTPKRQNAVNAPFSRLDPQNGETLDRATRKHAASQTNAFPGILRAPPACKIDSGTKKTPPEGIRTAPLTSSNCPRGKTVCLDKAARRVGAGREDGKRKKAPRRKSGGAGDEGAGEGCQSSSSSTSITLVWVPLTNSAKASFQPSGLIQA